MLSNSEIATVLTENPPKELQKLIGRMSEEELRAALLVTVQLLHGEDPTQTANIA